MQRVLVLEDELMFATRLESGLKKMGYAPQMARSLEQALGFAEAQMPRLAIVSMGRAHLRPLEFAAAFKALPNPAPILAYLSHTLIPQTRAEAKAAGCDLLVPNSSIALRLPLLMARMAPLGGGKAEVEEAQRIADEEE